MDIFKSPISMRRYREKNVFDEKTYTWKPRSSLSDKSKDKRFDYSNMGDVNKMNRVMS